MTLTQGHPHHHRNQCRGIHDSLISISLCSDSRTKLKVEVNLQDRDNVKK